MTPDETKRTGRLARVRRALEEQLEFAAIYGATFDLDEAARRMVEAADEDA